MKTNFSADELIELVDNNLNVYLPESNKYNKELIDALEYSLYSGGKRVRPLLMLASCQSCNGDIKEVLPYACALEFIHTYSLIHDDLPCMDNDDYRRGKLTNHKVFGEAMALLAGDELLTAASRIMANEIVKSKNENHIKTMSLITACAEDMIMGQVSDIKWTKNNTIEDIQYVHTNKTGALIYAAVMSGAYIANADSNLLNNMDSFAKNYGLAFQLADDICDKSNEDEPNYVQVVGIEKAIKDLNKRIKDAKDAIKELENNSILYSLCDKLLESIK